MRLKIQRTLVFGVIIALLLVMFIPSHNAWIATIKITFSTVVSSVIIASMIFLTILFLAIIPVERFIPWVDQDAFWFFSWLTVLGLFILWIFDGLRVIEFAVMSNSVTLAILVLLVLFRSVEYLYEC